MDWGAAAITGGMGLLSHFTKPDAPDVESYRPKPVAERLDDIDPTWRRRRNKKVELAEELMEGEIPKQTRDMIEMIRAEQAWSGGYGTSERASMATARDLGLYSMQLIEAGTKLSDQITEFDKRIALDDAEMAYEAHASKVNQEMAGYRDKSRSHANLWKGLMQMGSLAMFGNEDGGSPESSVDDMFDVETVSGTWGGSGGIGLGSPQTDSLAEGGFLMPDV